MTEKSRQYTPATKNRLFLLSGNQCAEPNCTRQLIAKDGISITAKICHIEAASKGGARYNASMTDDERRHYNNLIMLCDEDHTIIDNIENESKYPVSLLKQWKKDHESRMLLDRLKTNPSLLKDAITAIANIDWEEVKEKESLKSFDPWEKISYNSIKRNSSIIEEYKTFHGKINSLYDEIEENGSFKKARLLNNIRSIYINVRSKYILDERNYLPIIRANADNIYDEIYEALFNKMNDTNLYDEDVALALNVILVDAFIRCKILEEPE